ncbi:MAG: type II toxin-antitoxin system HicB family antitoxin [Chloroflexota bacterium]|nr:type II toxin-antitoxin system HicB family antitoxin [Chloroflexota bacterium]
MKKNTVLELTATFTPEEGGFVVRCPELGVTTEGDTFEEAVEYLYDAVTNYIDIVGLEHVLKDAPQIVVSATEPLSELPILRPKISFGAFDLKLNALVPA